MGGETTREFPLLYALQREILKLPTPPANLDEWYHWTIRLQNNFIHMSAIAKTKAQGGGQSHNNQNSWSNTNMNKKGGQNPWWFYLEPPRDPNTMDIDFTTTEERADLTKKGLCFKCKQSRHQVNNPMFHPKQEPWQHRWTKRKRKTFTRMPHKRFFNQESWINISISLYRHLLCNYCYYLFK